MQEVAREFEKARAHRSEPIAAASDPCTRGEQRLPRVPRCVKKVLPRHGPRCRADIARRIYPLSDEMIDKLADYVEFLERTDRLHQLPGPPGFMQRDR